ncbi:unnamed protein product [Menidia menidia]|uniref:(Atlantic silverside) hypothetical protein n=1 Tax=Menidia menidia TaxID=238744 RepID=A0A8S4A6D0_9TELE|nr:unnamed protein product [Menidia menidia]
MSPESRRLLGNGTTTKPTWRRTTKSPVRKKNTESHIQKKIRAAFEAFDYESNHTVDVREISTIMYALGCFPTQAGLHDFIVEVEEDNTGYIYWERFLPVMTKVLLEQKFPPIPEDHLLQAFEVLDKEKKGFLEPEELTKYMTQEGEPFTQEEMDEMLTALTDRDSNLNLIIYKDLISQLTIDPDISREGRAIKLTGQRVDSSNFGCEYWSLPSIICLRSVRTITGFLFDPGRELQR